MLFCETEALRVYERMMKQPPRYAAKPIPVKDRDCPHCLYYSEERKGCTLKKCIVFGCK